MNVASVISNNWALKRNCSCNFKQFFGLKPQQKFIKVLLYSFMNVCSLSITIIKSCNELQFYNPFKFATDDFANFIIIMTSGYKDIGIRRSEFFLHLIFSVLKLWSRNEKYEFSQGNFPAKTKISLIVQKFVTRFFLLKSNLCTVLNKLTPRTISQMRAYTFLLVQCRVSRYKKPFFFKKKVRPFFFLNVAKKLWNRKVF